MMSGYQLNLIIPAGFYGQWDRIIYERYANSKTI